MVYDPFAGTNTGFHYQPPSDPTADPIGSSPYLRQNGGPVSVASTFPAPNVTPYDPSAVAQPGVGKFNLALNFPAPWVAQGGKPTPTAPTTPELQGGAPGLFETALRGLENIPGQIIPSFINQHINNLFGLVGKIADVPLSLVKPISELPSGQDVPTAYSQLPNTDAKAAYNTAIANDPVNREHYMAQYIRYFEKDYASASGRSRLFSSFDLPSESLGEQLGHLVFGALSAQGLVVKRAYVGSAVRDVQGTVVNADPTTLPADLAYMRQQYLDAGSTPDAYGKLLDDITTSRWAWSHDPGLFGVIGSFAADVFTDPLTWETLGLGKAAGLAGEGAVAQRASEVSSRLKAEDPAAYARIYQNGTDVGHVDNLLTRADEVRQARPDIYQAAHDSPTWAGVPVTARMRNVVRLQPLIQQASEITNKAVNPMSWFGADHIGALFSRRTSNSTMRGLVNAYGSGNVLEAARLDTTGNLANYLGTAGKNALNGVQQDSIAQHIVGSGGIDFGTRTPTEIAAGRLDAWDHMGSKMSPTFERITNDKVRSVMPDFILRGGGGKAAQERLLADARSKGSLWMQDTLGVTPELADRIMSKANEQKLGAYHGLNFARVVYHVGTMKDQLVTEARKALDSAQTDAEIKSAQDHLDFVTRLTPIGERELTLARAQEALAAVERGDASAARAIVAQYDGLGASFRNANMADDELLANLRLALTDLIANGKERLVQSVPTGDLPEPLRTFIRNEEQRYGQSAYQMGVGPTHPWTTTTDAEGKVIAAHPWMDTVHSTENKWLPNRMDRVRFGMFTPIRGNRQLLEARQRFVRIGIRKYGISEGQGLAMFRAVSEAAKTQRSGPRGLSAEGFLIAVKEVTGSAKLDDNIIRELGDRGVAQMVAEAWNVDASTVGLTTKASAALKQRWLFAGQIADHLWPMIKFYGNPNFISQEWLEGPILNIMRGVPPAFTGHTASDLEYARNRSLISKIKSEDPTFDQTEFNLVFQAAKARATEQIAGADTPARGSIARARSVLDAIPRPGGALVRQKERNYLRQTFYETGRDLKEAMNKNQPDVWPIMEQHYGTVDPAEIVRRYFEEKGMATVPQEARLHSHVADMSKPYDLGRQDHILMGDLAHFEHFSSTEELRSAVRGGRFLEEDFRANLKDKGATDSYIDRAWEIAQRPNKTEFRNLAITEHRNAGLSQSAAEAKVRPDISAFIRYGKTLGLSPDDYLAHRFPTVRSFMDWQTARDAAIEKINASTPSMALREGFRLFADELDPSAKALLADEMATATGHAAKWGRDAETYAARLFEVYSSDPGAVSSGNVAGILNAYSHYAHEVLGIKDKMPGASIVESIRGRKEPGAHWNMDEQRFWETARLTLLRQEEQAFKTHYYARGRTWAERSLNHPYLGLYPLSYMWGKIMPEMIRFLVKRPFGLKAPLGGLALAKDVWNSTQLQIQTDQNLRDWLKSHPGAITYFSVLMPGTPWDLPVNLNVLLRRSIQNVQANQALPPGQQKPFDVGTGVQDLIDYSFGLGHYISTITKALQGTKQQGPSGGGFSAPVPGLPHALNPTQNSLPTVEPRIP